MPLSRNPWNSHDFRVKMLDWTPARGSRLAFTCRWCGRKFCQFTLQDQEAWAVDSDGHALESGISNRWLSETCTRLFATKDDDDRKRLSRPPAPVQ